MREYFKLHNQLLLNIGGFAINLVPFLLYLMLSSRRGDIVVNALPFALFYSFRRTALFSIRGNEQHDNLFGWIGLGAAVFGLIVGLFGTLNSMIWDLSGMFVGIGAAFFPSVQKQFNLTHRQSKNQQRNNSWLLLLAVLLMIGMIILTGKNQPVIAFATVLLFASLGVVGFYYDPLRKPSKSEVKLNPFNVVLFFLLLGSVLLVRIGRSLGQGQPVLLGIELLAVILIAMIMAIISNRPHQTNISKGLRMRLMIFGICADFCAIFSALYLGVIFGIKVYAWILVSYILAFLLGKKMVNWLANQLPFTPFMIELVGIILGMLLTLNIYTYFIGIFLVRAFASVQNQAAICAYDAQDNVHNSYMVSYRLMSIGGLTTQLILWLSLLCFVRQAGLFGILADFTFHETTTKFIQPLLFTQIILVLWATGFILRTAQIIHREEKDD